MPIQLTEVHTAFCYTLVSLEHPKNPFFANARTVINLLATLHVCDLVKSINAKTCVTEIPVGSNELFPTHTEPSSSARNRINPKT